LLFVPIICRVEDILEDKDILLEAHHQIVDHDVIVENLNSRSIDIQGIRIEVRLISEARDIGTVVTTAPFTFLSLIKVMVDIQGTPPVNVKEIRRVDMIPVLWRKTQ